MKKKYYNYKFIIGLVIGLLLITGVSASGSYLARDVYYDSTYSSLSSGNVQMAIDDVREKIEAIRPGNCKDGYECLEYKTTLELGDYVYYEPEVESYETDTSKTNYSSSQTIYPSELKLWRVLFINEDGTVDIVSEDVSSTDVYFKGLVGYQNFVGYLNVLASQYETEGITLSEEEQESLNRRGSRHFGYNGQTEYIEDTSMFTETAPWACSTGGSCSPAPVESQGGGDKLYERDYNQAQTLFKTAAAYKVGTTTTSYYWMASRYYHYTSSTIHRWIGRLVTTSGSVADSNLYYYYGEFIENSYSFALRPVITLSSELSYEGVGIKEAPMRIIAS